MRRLPVLLALLGAGVSTGLQAAPMFREVSNAELEQMRGRYAEPGRIVSFGLEMMTSWQGVDGQRLASMVSLNADTATMKPTITVYTGSSGSAPSTGTAASGGQIVGSVSAGGTTGVLQTTQVAGDLNQVGNALSVQVVRQDSGDSSSSSLANGMQQVARINSATTLSLPAGTGATIVSTSGGRLSLSLTIPGEGSTTQQLGGGGLSQQAQVLGNQNTVTNITRLTVGMAAGGGGGTTLQQAGLMLRNWP